MTEQDPSLSNPLEAVKLVYRLQHDKDARHRKVESTPLSPEMFLLRSWQAERLARAYADVRARPSYEKATDFFLTDLYGAKDFSQRDHDIDRVYRLARRFFPPQMIKFLTLSVELNQLSAKLDTELVGALVNDLGMTDTLTPEMYTAAYRVCDNYDIRLHQIDLVVQVGKRIDRAMRLPLIGTALKLAQAPAHTAGWHEMYDFLVRGFDAFKKMKNRHAFFQLIQTRETKILKDIFAGIKNPFVDAPIVQLSNTKDAGNQTT